MPPARLRFLAAALFVPTLALATASCGGPQVPPGGTPAQSAEVECPDPIGTIPRESCAEIADDFGSFDVSSSLKLAGASRGAEVRIEAIRAAADLAAKLKERRVALCESYNTCKTKPAEHAAEDQRLAGLMKELIDTWDARKFLNADDVVRFRAGVTKIAGKLDGTTAVPSAEGGAPVVVKPAKKTVRGEALARIEGAGLKFTTSDGNVTITSTAAGAHDALRAAAEELRGGGGRMRVRIFGSYTPSTAPLIAAGDELTIRFKYRATQAGELHVALRSLEDPDAVESTIVFRVAAGTGTESTTLTATPGSSGFYVGISARGAGNVEFDDVELVRQNAVIAAARAESASEPHLVSSCSTNKKKALAGKASFLCESGDGDKLVLGQPKGHLYLALKTPAGERARIRTLSLEGGRSLDLNGKEDTELVIGLDGPGSSTIQSIELLPVGSD
ncbi:hypothetical protein [Polyangium mundeleinium]|uniref:Lipoprotein n=1 Tax=Polyangium mundeleinium TaxID=2995306 RepID=A0ABT5EW20_9BACT|nr:hypothetical protein [Polyangium mundeleinium]MDC0745122.1 hypothetical protein [Polyangium mundeleinium]